MKRRELFKWSAVGAAGLLAGKVHAQPRSGECPFDGTPNQFIPKTAPDPLAHVNDIEKYPKCPYCGMDRHEYHHSRMLIHYSDNLADGVCSLHCAGISLSLNVDRNPQAIWVGDNASPDAVKPLVEVENATFLVGSAIQGVMTANSKVAYSDEAVALQAQAEHGGEFKDFDGALLSAYVDMSADVARIRQRRAERRRRQMEAQQK